MFLDTILAYKRTVIADLKNKYSYQYLGKKAQAPRDYPKVGFYEALSRNGLSLIAEVKKASPSKGIIRQDFHPVELAKEFEQYGAAALSVLTDERFFCGRNDYLTDIKKISPLPILRKDFIIDEAQLFEAKIIGADAALLIVAALSPQQLIVLSRLAKDIDLDILCEVHNEKELEIALASPCSCIGINNRDLTSFHVDIATTFQLANLIPADRIVVSESGISTADQLHMLNNNSIDAVLIGEGLATNPGLLSYWKKE